MATITQFPRGLVSLTGLRDMGEAPRELAEQIVPTIDVTEFLLLNRETFTATDSPAARGTRGVIVVPPGELWYIHAFGVYASTAAGQTIEISAGVGMNDLYFPMGRPGRSVGATQACQSYLDRPQWIGPGNTLAILVHEIVAGPVNVIENVSFSRLRI